jgi:integrase
MTRLEAAIGKLDEVRLVDLKRDHGRKYMTMMLKTKKADGSALSLGTCKKEATIIAAMISHGLRECDLATIAGNPFSRLPWPAEDELAMNKKLPLPDALVSSMEARLSEGKVPELSIIWTILAATGARLGEIAGLTKDDIIIPSGDIDGEVPHVFIRPNSIRRLKTTSSIRSVPLVGDALVAAKEAGGLHR